MQGGLRGSATELYVKPAMQLHPGLCAGGSRRTNGPRYPPVGARRGLRLHQLLHGFFTKSQVKSSKGIKIQNSQQTSLRGVSRVQAHASVRGKDVHNMKARSQDL